MIPSATENTPSAGGVNSPNISEAAKFIGALIRDDRPGIDHYTYQTIDDAEKKRPPLAKILHGAGNKAKLIELNYQGAGVFITINATDGKGRKAENVTRVRAVFVDIDKDGSVVLARIAAGEVTPHIIVESSPGKFHVYWLVDADFPLNKFSAVQAALAQKFGTDNVKDLPRILRLPGFYHRKGEPFQVRIVELNEHPHYSIEQIVDGLGLTLDAPSVVPPRGEGEIARVFCDGARNDSLSRQAYSLRKKGVTVEAIEATLLTLNETACDPPLGEAEVRAIAQGKRKVAPDKFDLRVSESTGAVITDEANILLILQRDPDLIGVIAYDEFRAERVLRMPIPGDARIVSDRDTPRQWRDSDTVALQVYMQTKIIPRVGRDKIENVVDLHARQSCAFHPVRDYLQRLEWDKKLRLDTWLTDYLGATAQPREYLAAVGSKFIISAVARIFEPGCQADSSIVLEGRQGSGKSSALRTLASDPWFSDRLPGDLSHKDARDHLRGKWIIELPELAQFKRSEIETVKAFLSRRTESYRPSYGRNEVSFDRQCVFAGSTNADTYLVDRTGNRRFWIVACGVIDLAALARDRDQLFAEAVARYRAREPWHLSRELNGLADEQATGRIAHDPWTARVAEELRGLGGKDVAPGEVMGLMGLPDQEQHAFHAARVGQILRDLGWLRGTRDRTRGQLYVRPA